MEANGEMKRGDKGYKKVLLRLMSMLIPPDGMDVIPNYLVRPDWCETKLRIGREVMLAKGKDTREDHSS